MTRAAMGKPGSVIQPFPAGAARRLLVTQHVMRGAYNVVGRRGKPNTQWCPLSARWEFRIGVLCGSSSSNMAEACCRIT